MGSGGAVAVLGLNAYHGDAAAALIVDGELVAAAEEERFTRLKHCAGFPANAAAWCLADAGLRAADLTHVAIARNPRANAGRKVAWMLRHHLRITALRQRLANAARVANVRSVFAEALEVDAHELTAQFHQVEHHQAHVASAFFVSPFDHAAVLSVDGFGDFTSTMLAAGEGSHFGVLDRVCFPHSLGLFYTALSQWLGFTSYGDEGKVMGLASFGEPRFVNELRQMVVVEDGSFRLRLEYFCHQAGVHMTWNRGTPALGQLYSQRLVDMLGPARPPRGALSEHYVDVAASLQTVLEEAYVSLASSLANRTGETNLCIAGGVGLNALANARVLRETPFEHVYVQPAAGDSGTAVGAAYWVWNQMLGEPRGFVMDHAYMGPAYSDEECAAALSEAGIASECLSDDELITQIAAHIAAGDIVGWFQGRMEFGPRALGNRSILADPRRADMKDLLNERVKHREAFRPFAPSILAEATHEWYEQDHPSPYMVLVYKTRSEKRDLVPAVNHVDDTGRLQTVTREANPRYWRLIKEFERLTGVPIVLNTSFNDSEPIVMTPAEAIETYKKTRMDVLVLGNHVARQRDFVRRSRRQREAAPEALS